MPVRVVVERGPKGKKSAAFALDWPGWSRGAKTVDVAVDTLAAYRDRYRPVALIAGMEADFDAEGELTLVEDRVGPGSTDFWGISFAPSSTEMDPMDPGALDRAIRLLEACWTYFDAVVARVSPEMRLGPRGGGRNREQIVRHVLRNESEEFAKRIGLRYPDGAVLEPGALGPYREEYVAAMRAYNAGEGKRMKSWTLPFLVRHSAFHVMDHAWEMEDKDLTAEA